VTKFTFLLLLTLLLSSCSVSPSRRRAHFLQSGQSKLAEHDYGRAILELKNAVQLDPKDARAHLLLGKAYWGNGDAPLAFAHLQKAAELNPKSQEAQITLAQIMVASRDRVAQEEARKRMRDLLRAAPGNLDAIETLAAAEWSLGNQDEALRRVESGLRRFPESQRELINLVRFQVAQGDFAHASEVLAQAAGKAPRSTPILVTWGEVLLLQSKRAEAQERFRLALEVDPANAPAMLDLAGLLRQNGKASEAEQLYRRVSRVKGETYSYVHASYLLQTGRPQAAIAEFERLAQQSPQDGAARARLVVAYVLAGRRQDARRVLNATIASNRFDLDALIERGILCLSAGDTVGAQRDLDAALRLRPDSAPIHYLLAKLQEKRNSPLLAREQLLAALRNDRTFVAARLDLAAQYLAANDPKSALDSLRPALHMKNVSVLTLRNWALLSLQDFESFERGVAEGLAIQQTPELLVQEAIVKLRRGDYPGARLHLEKALNGGPEDSLTLQWIARSYLAERKPKLAIDNIKAYLERHPENGQAHLLLGRLLQEAGEANSARLEFETAKAELPDPSAATLALARVDASEGKWDHMRKILSGVSVSGNVQARQMLGELNDQSGNYNAAMAEYRAVLELDPYNTVALNNLAFDLAEHADNAAEALKYAQRAKQLAPENPAIDDTLGWVLYRKGLFELALQHLERAAAQRKTPERLYHLGMAYIKCGRTDEGNRLIQSAGLLR
jgi:Tfp pilus assembly protein PilF